MKSYLDILDKIEEFLRKENYKIVFRWKILGVAVAFLILFCGSMWAPSIKAFLPFIVGAGVWGIYWEYRYRIHIRNTESSIDGVRISRGLENIRLYTKDSIIRETIKSRAERGELRNKEKELKALIGTLETFENIIHVNEIIKMNGIVFREEDTKKDETD